LIVASATPGRAPGSIDVDQIADGVANGTGHDDEPVAIVKRGT
jgi:hypothetical protein